MTERDSFRQIFGTEMEWPISVRKGTDPTNFEPLSISNYIDQFLVDALPEGVVGTLSWLSASYENYLSNGARYYNDCGRFEYATPEDVSIESVVLSEFAGERIVIEGLRKHIASARDVREGFLSKRVDGAHHSTWGYHANIGEDRTWLRDVADIKMRTRPLLTHLATSLPMLGGGAVSLNGYGEYVYSWGQKVLTPINEDYGTGTTSDIGKPIVNLRDKPYASAEKYWRLHLVGGDPHVSPWASKMFMGTVSLVLLAAREGRMNGMVFESNGTDAAARVMQRATFDMKLKEKYYLEGIKGASKARDIQEEIINRVDQTTGRTAEQDKILQEWKIAHEVMKRNPDELEKSDAILKRRLLYEDRDRRKKKTLDAVSRLRDLRYTSSLWITKEQAQSDATTDELIESSPAGKIRRKYFADDMKQLGSVEDRIVNPPRTTRAYRRGREILRHSAYWKSWYAYEDLDNKHNRISVLDPFDGAIETEYIKVNDIIKE